MKKSHQREIINGLCRDQRKYMLERLKNVPENWDGIELRAWFIEVARNGYSVDRHMDRKRKSNFNNDVITENL